MTTPSSLTISITPEKQKALHDIAMSMDCPSDMLINQAIDAFLETYQWNAKEIRRALDEADAGGTFHESEAIDTLIQSFKPHA